MLYFLLIWVIIGVVVSYFLYWRDDKSYYYTRAIHILEILFWPLSIYWAIEDYFERKRWDEK